MKKSLALLAVLGCFSQSSMAATTFDLSTLLQPSFKALSEDFGAALSYKPITPAAPLGITGFDIGVEVSATDMTKSAAAWKTATGKDALSTLPVPKLHVAKGLPFGIDVAAFYTAIPTTNISVYGAELRYAILEGGLTMPAVAVRGAMTKLNGIDQLSFSTKSADISISKGFAMFTPYAGVGQVWVDSSTTVAGLQAETFTQPKMFVGANLNLGLTNLAAEVDKTGGVQTISAKMGFRW
jgi:hypothetical protein